MLNKRPPFLAQAHLSRRVFLEICAGSVLAAGLTKGYGCRETGHSDDSPSVGIENRLTLPGPEQTLDLTRGSILFIGTATVLIRYAGFTILTEPNFLHRGEYVHLGYGLRSQRLTEPAMNLEDLPPLDLVLLSHLHEDHFDRLVNERLERTIPITTTPKAAHGLKRGGFQMTIGLETWDDMTFIKGPMTLRVTAMPGRHGPFLLHSLLPPVMGSMVEFFATPSERTGHTEPLFRLYITGDTLVFDELQQIPKRFPTIDQALLHLGGPGLWESS